MNPTRFAKSNTVKTAPPGMDNCHDVHAYADGQHVITCWQPTPEERVRIGLGEPVWLVVWGANMPPVALMVEEPFA